MRENSIVPENILLIEPEKINIIENKETSQNEPLSISIEPKEEIKEQDTQATKSVSFNNITIKKIE